MRGKVNLALAACSRGSCSLIVRGGGRLSALLECTRASSGACEIDSMPVAAAASDAIIGLRPVETKMRSSRRWRSRPGQGTSTCEKASVPPSIACAEHQSESLRYELHEAAHGRMARITCPSLARRRKNRGRSEREQRNVREALGWMDAREDREEIPSRAAA